MIDRFTALATGAAYQASVAVGIALLPLAVTAKRLGITLPVHRLIERTESAYQNRR